MPDKNKGNTPYTDKELELLGDILTWKCLRCGIRNNKPNIIENRNSEDKTGVCFPCAYNNDNPQTSLEEFF